MSDVAAIDHQIGGSTTATSELRMAERAACQHGVVARWQLLELGLTRRAIDLRLACGRLHVIHRGVYAVGHQVLTIQGRWMAAVLSYGPSAVLSHTDAATHWNLRQIGAGAIHVTVPGRGRRGRAGIRVHSVRRLHPDEALVEDGIPMTSVARTLFDSAEILAPRQLERLFEEAERQRLFDLRALDAVCARNPGRHARRAISALLKALQEPPATRSELERLFLDFCRAYGLPEPVFNTVVCGYEVDAWWPGTKIVVELDSFAFHSSRSAFESDRARDMDLKLQGIEVLRVTDRRIKSDGPRLAQQLRHLLQATA